jgi:4-hydroxy-tetrahydrodipicolinate synthase
VQAHRTLTNNPTTTHFDFGIPLLERLAKLSNVVAVKMPAPTTGAVADDLTVWRGTLPADFAIGYSGDWVCADALLAGADTWYSVLGGTLPDIAMTLAQAAQNGDAASVQRQNAALAPLWSLFKAHGGVRVVYAIANHLGLTDAKPPRPILPLDAIQTRQVIAALNALDV